MVRLTDRLDMIIAVDRDVKPQTKHTKRYITSVFAIFKRNIKNRFFHKSSFMYTKICLRHKITSYGVFVATSPLQILWRQ